MKFGYNEMMNQAQETPPNAPQPVLLATYRAALGLKLFAVIFAIYSGSLIVDEWWVPFERWWLTGLNTFALFLFLLPWCRLLPENHRGQTASYAFNTGLVLGIILPNIELVHVTYQSYVELLTLPGFNELLGFTQFESNMIHGFGQFFMMIPVVLATWRHRFWGMGWSMGLAGLCYILTPLLSVPEGINFPLYFIRGFVLLGVALILAFTTYFLAESERRERQKLEEANRLLAEQSLIIEELAVSSERNRLARELHDTLAHTLSGTAVQLEAVKTLLGFDLPSAKQELSEAQTQIKSGLAESRRAIQALRATPVESLGLNMAIQKQAEQVAARNQLRSTIHLDKLDQTLEFVVEQAIFRIIQEGLGNIERHAAATHFELSGEQTKSGYRWLVQDNGQGFDPQQVSNTKRSRFGLIGMQERAGLIGALLSIESRPGAGTTIKLYLPLR